MLKKAGRPLTGRLLRVRTIGMRDTGDEYARMAGIYDPATAWALDPMRRELARLAAGNGPVLDVCCGTGRQCLFYAREGLATVGLDLSAAMLAQAAGLPGALPFVRGDAARLPFGDASFGFASVMLALHEKPPGLRPAILNEMLRMVRPGGLLAVADYLLPATLSQKAASLGIALVERLAGREHHGYYAQFLSSGGLEGLLAGLGLRPHHLRRHLLGQVGLALIQRPA